MRIFDAPEVMGHRGAGRGSVSDRGSDGSVRENTPGSFRAAVDQGATWIELDVHRNADGALLLYHDGTLPDGRAILDLTAEECRAAGLFTLAEGLAALPDEVGIDVEIKTVMEDAAEAPERRTVALLLPELAREAHRRRVFASSFDPAAILAVRAELPEVPIAWMPWVRGSLDLAVAGAAGMGCAAVGIDARSFGVNGDSPEPRHRTVAATVELAHRAGLEVYSWCPAPEDAARFVKAGVDAVCVDDVPGTVKALAKP